MVGSNDRIVAVAIHQFRKTSDDDSKPDEVTFVRDIPGYGELLWEEMRLDEITIMIGRMVESGT